MNRVYAFTDESGNYGFDFDKKDISTYFIVTAIIVEEDKVELIKNEIELVRKKYFQTGEIKSSSVGKAHDRRTNILSQLLKSDFKIFSVVLNKAKIKQDSGLMFKKSFYKFTNNLVHKELRGAFRILTICADQIGGNEYMRSFAEYVKEREDIPSLLGDRDFYFQDSKNNILIQLADFISGTLSFVFEDNKRINSPNYLKILEKNLIRIELYPKEIRNYIFDNSVISEEYDKTIADICLKRAQEFLVNHNNEHDEDTINQIIVLKYLCFRFLNNDTRKYIPTREIINNLKYRTSSEISIQYFRTKIIAKLRDAGVIISSSPKGYKIPSKKSELYDFINHGTSIIMPMLARLKLCRDIVHLGTCGNLDLFDNSEYESLKAYFDLSINIYDSGEK